MIDSLKVTASVLPQMNKVFESILVDQFTEYFNNLLSVFISAFRKGYSCQDALLHLTELWKNALLKNETVGSILVDLSKAFDCMSQPLL